MTYILCRTEARINVQGQNEWAGLEKGETRPYPEMIIRGCCLRGQDRDPHFSGVCFV